MNVIGNNKGMSLVGVMIAFGLMGLLTMFLTDLAVYSSKVSHTAQTNADILNYLNQVRSNLQFPDRATVMLKDNKVDNSVLVDIKDPVISGLSLLKFGFKQNVKDSWQVQNVKFENVQAAGAAGLYRLNISVTIFKDNKRNIGPSRILRSLGEVYCMVNSNVIISCLGAADPVANAKVQCQALGGNWNSEAAFGSQCVIRDVASLLEEERKKEDDGERDDDHDGYNDHTKKPCRGH